MKYIKTISDFVSESLTSVEYRIEDNIPKIAEVMGYKGVDKSDEVGFGYYGVAYNLGNNKILKVTSDKKEAESANYMIGKKPKHIVEYYDVRRIITPDEVKAESLKDKIKTKNYKLSNFSDEELEIIRKYDSGKRTYVLVLEKVTPILEGSEKRRLRDHPHYIAYNTSGLRTLSSPPSKPRLYIADKIYLRLQPYLSKLENELHLELLKASHDNKEGDKDEYIDKRLDKLENMSGSLFKEAYDFFKLLQSQRKSIIKEMKKYDLDLKDAHPGNVGMDDNGIIKFFDPSEGLGKYKKVNKVIYI